MRITLRTTLLALAALTLAASTSCGGGGKTDDGKTDVVADVPVNPLDTVGDEATPPDTDAPEVRSDVADPGTGDDTVTDTSITDGTVVGEDVQDEEVPPLPTCVEAGGFLCPCTYGSECFTGLCIDTMDQSVCSKQCGLGVDCPTGWTCDQVNVGGELIFGCIYPFPTLCRPCEKDQDCVPTTGAMGRQFKCIDGGPSGKFCGAQCTRSSDCPEYEDETGAKTTFECVPVATDSGEVKQCRPTSGTCPCTPKYKNGGFQTDCYVQNEFGKCTGKRTCSQDCTADAPTPEDCNNIDDDCNGFTDDDIAARECDLKKGSWTCKGQSQCSNGRWGICTGSYPAGDSPEYGIGACNALDDDCDGVTDQGFPDMDNDKIADCVDPDRDGDSVLNATDNCPDTANLEQANNDGDQTGDLCDTDDDNDGVLDDVDNCPFVKNLDQGDADEDLKGNACDCDADDDGVANAADLDMEGGECPDPGPDADNCLLVENPDQLDTNLDLVGDACDCDIDSDTVKNNNPGCENLDKPDNCRTVSNLDQLNTDLDGDGDACDCDIDNDRVSNNIPDVCPAVPAPDNCTYLVNPVDPQTGVQADRDGDFIGDACDCDIDDDGVPNQNPGCPACAPCDNCTYEKNPNQENSTGGEYGDVCNDDWDSDDIPNADDLCPYTFSTIDELGVQPDLDADGQGDVCDCDVDGDDIGNVGVDPDGQTCPDVPTPDNCPRKANEDQADLDLDRIGDACDCDVDGDGDPQPNFECPTPAVPDCEPFDPEISHLAVEKCNQINDDCDDATDEPDALGCQTFYYDKDNDGYGTAQSKCLCAPNGFYRAPVSGDCNDDDLVVNPGVQEVCNNGRDDNCNSSENDKDATGCTPFYVDDDTDGYGTAEFECRCYQTGGRFKAFQSGDCNDGNRDVNPGKTEICNDDLDNNCINGQNDENAQNCRWFFYDGDVDTYGTSAQKCFCYGNDALKYNASRAGDCDDVDPTVNPAAREVCNNSKDDDCDGFQNTEGANECLNYYFDGDGDTFGLTNSMKCLCATMGSYTSRSGGDCQDANPQIHPDAKEICDGIDNNCDAQIDEGPTTLCAALPNATSVCQSGQCVVGDCLGPYFNVNGVIADGCECNQDAEDFHANTCADALPLGDSWDNGSALPLVAGRIVPNGDEDWYYVVAKDSADTGTFGNLGTDRFNLVATLKFPTDGSLKVDVRRGGCGGGQTCGGVTYQWKPTAASSCISPTGDHWRCCAPGVCSAGGEMAPADTSTMNACCDNVAQCTDSHNAHHCDPDDATFYIRVYHDPSFPASTLCAQTEYALEVSNGK